MNLIRTTQLAIGALALVAAIHVHAQESASASMSAPASVSAYTAKSAKSADRALRRRVLTALGKEKNMRATSIIVRVNDGAVLLEGTVPEQMQIEQATRVAQAVPGVKSVRNALTLSTF